MFHWEMKESKGFELKVPGDGYASASKFGGDDEAAYFLSSVSSYIGFKFGSGVLLLSSELHLQS